MYCEASMPPRSSSQLCQSELYRSDFFSATRAATPSEYSLPRDLVIDASRRQSGSDGTRTRDLRRDRPAL